MPKLRKLVAAFVPPSLVWAGTFLGVDAVLLGAVVVVEFLGDLRPISTAAQVAVSTGIVSVAYFVAELAQHRHERVKRARAGRG